jgi:hypothetical protein
VGIPIPTEIPTEVPIPFDKLINPQNFLPGANPSKGLPGSNPTATPTTPKAFNNPNQQNPQGLSQPKDPENKIAPAPIPIPVPTGQPQPPCEAVKDCCEMSSGQNNDNNSQLIALVNRNNTNILVGNATGLANTGLINTVIGNLATFQGKFLKFVEWSGIQRVLDFANLAVNLHNAMMLSNDIAQTLAFGLDNVLTLFNAQLKDSEGNSIPTSDFIGNKLKEALYAILGEETAVALTNKIAQFNRIYQASMNAVYAISGILDATRSVLELIGEYTGKIGNSLKRSGAVLENSYNWMFEDINQFTTTSNRWNKLFRNIDDASTVAGSMAAVTGDVVTISSEINNLNATRTELTEAITNENGNDLGYGSIPTADVIDEQELVNAAASRPNSNLTDPRLGS